MNYSVILMGKALLAIMDADPMLLNIISDYPPPFLTCAFFTDWIKPFTEKFIQECQQNFVEGITNQRLQLGEETLKLFNAVESKIAHKVKMFQEEDQILGEPILTYDIIGEESKDQLLLDSDQPQEK